MLGYDKNGYFIAIGNETSGTYTQVHLRDFLINKNHYAYDAFSCWTWMNLEIDTYSSNFLIAMTTCDGNVHITSLPLKLGLLNGNNSTLSVGISYTLTHPCNCKMQNFRVSFPQSFKSNSDILLLEIDYIGKINLRN